MDIFTTVAIVTVAAALLVWSFHKVGQSGVVAYLVLGAAVGPFGLGIVGSADAVGTVSEIGVILLLFFIGLDFHFAALRKMTGIASLGMLIQVAITAVATGFLAQLILHCSLLESAMIGLGLAMSSTAIVLKGFDERRESDTRPAQVALAVLLGQDFIALLAVAVIPLMIAQSSSGGGGSWLKLSGMLAGLPVLYIVSRRVLPFLFRRAALSRNQEAFGLCSIGACLLVAALAHLLGASAGLGAFLGGLVFADSPYAHQIRADLATLKNLALGFFFFAVGMMMDLEYGLENWVMISGGVLLLVTIKAVATYLALVTLKESAGVAASACVALAQSGEFTFVIVAVAVDAGAMSVTSQQALIGWTVSSMLIAPALVGRSIAIGTWWGRRVDGERGVRKVAEALEIPDDIDTEIDTTAQFVRTSAVVVGFGPVGRTLRKLLIRFGIDTSVIDMRPETVRKLLELGGSAIFGDASRREVLRAAGLAEAKFLIITLPDFASRAAIITSARAINPELRVICRARYLDEERKLSDAGADKIAFEECEVASQLARILLSELDIRDELVEHEVTKIRSEISTGTGFTRVIRVPLGVVDEPSGETRPGEPGAS